MTPEEKLQLMDVESSVSSEMLFKFGECTEKLHPKMEICAILILERLESKINPDKRCRAVFYSRHDSVYLHYNPISIASVATEEDIRNLIRCGVIYNDDGSFQI